MTGTALSLRNVGKAFGSLEIIRGVSLDIASGQRHAIIGPNGAGKTTLFNLISGRFHVSTGEILLNDVRIDQLPPHRINRMGLSRSFQITSIFHRLSVFENLRCALLWSMGYRYSFWTPLWRQRELNERTNKMLEDLNLAGRRDNPELVHRFGIPPQQAAAELRERLLERMVQAGEPKAQITEREFYP